MFLQAVLAQVLGAAVALAASSDSDFRNKVQPILNANCTPCHSETVKTSGFSIATMQSVIAGGNKYGLAATGGAPDKSPLLRLLKGELTPRMPLGKTLSAADVATIEDWVRGLTPDLTSKGDRWLWPFRKPVRAEPPRVTDAGWVGNPIDAFILHRLQERGLRPAPPASRRVLARRLYFDLVGMPPTVAEMNAFLADSSEQAYPNLVDKLLADPRYGERWGRHWLDLVRYAETDGLEDDQPLGNAWRYRDWVVDALNSDMPYDQFVMRQLAGGDAQSRTGLILAQDAQSYIPTAFLRLGPWDAGSIPPLENRQLYLDDVTSATGSVFLGLTVGCARCHDHKYDPIPTDDYYRFQAFFNALKIEDVDVPFRNKAFAQQAAARVKEYEHRLESGPERKALDEFESGLLRKLRENKLEEARARGWSVQDVRLELRRKDQTLFSEAERDRHQELSEAFERVQDPEEKEALARFEETLLRRLREASGLDATARYGELTVRDVKAELRDPSQTVFSEAEKLRHRELSAAVAVIRRKMARFGTRALSVVNVPGPPNGPGVPATHVLVGGDFRHPAKAVEPGFPSAITGNSDPAEIQLDRYMAFPTRGRRLALARWIADPDNPLTARVMVNRIWQHHFGRGIVETASDFGRNGSRPTHPELLDWLALKFIEEKWSIKAIHRLMLDSSTYRQASANPAAEGNGSDPENTLLWRFRTRRLDAEEIRDSILWTSGRLSLARGGPSVFPPMAPEVADLARNPAGVAGWESNDREEDSRRRSIYTFQRRSLPHPLMLAFDAPVFNESCERRSVTTTALQALSMLNDGLINEEAAHLAERVERAAGADRAAQIARAFEVVLSRPPKPAEIEKLRLFPGALRDLCRVLLNSNEFVYID